MRRPTGSGRRSAGPADLVLSDMAANTVGHPQTDHLRTMGLVEAALDFAADMLQPGGAFVAKVLAGGADSGLVAELKRRFATVKHAKPPASRKGSSEWYVVAQGFKGQTATRHPGGGPGSQPRSPSTRRDPGFVRGDERESRGRAAPAPRRSPP